MRQPLFELREPQSSGFEFPRMPGAARVAWRLVVASLALAVIFAAASITKCAWPTGEGKTLAGIVSADR